MGIHKQIYETGIRDAIDNYGRNVTVVYATQVNCSSCSYDPVNQEATNAMCSTCNGQFFYEQENELRVKGVLKTFLGKMGFDDYSLQKFGYVPDHDARATFWLEDVLLDEASVTGESYIDPENNIRIEVDAKKYTVNSTQRTGIDKLKVIIATLKEKKNG